jgi:hypothetical protein
VDQGEIPGRAENRGESRVSDAGRAEDRGEIQALDADREEDRGGNQARDADRGEIRALGQVFQFLPEVVRADGQNSGQPEQQAMMQTKHRKKSPGAVEKNAPLPQNRKTFFSLPTNAGSYFSYLLP